MCGYFSVYDLQNKYIECSIVSFIIISSMKKMHALLYVHYLRKAPSVPVFYRGNKIWVRGRVRMN